MLEEIERDFEGNLMIKCKCVYLCLLAAATRDLKQLNEFTDDNQCNILRNLCFFMSLSQLQRERVWLKRWNVSLKVSQHIIICLI